MSDQRYSLKWLWEAIGLRSSQQGQTEPLLPNTTAVTHDGRHHLLHSTNYGQTDRAVVIVTGIPEGANELARSEGYTLDPLFAQADDETAVAQVYIGSKGLDVLDVRRRLPGYFEHGLRQAAATQEIHISAVSAGMFGLAAFGEMPAETFQRIGARVQSVTLASPFAGTNCIGNTTLRVAARLLGFPSTGRLTVYRAHHRVTARKRQGGASGSRRARSVDRQRGCGSCILATLSGDIGCIEASQTRSTARRTVARLMRRIRVCGATSLSG